MIKENELINSLKKDILPRLLDGALQGVYAFVLIYLAQTLKPETMVSNWKDSIWFLCFMLLWGAQHAVFRMVLLRRASRVESRYKGLPDGLYFIVTRAMTPHTGDAFFQALGLYLLMLWYFDSWMLHLPEYMANPIWSLAVVPLWLLQNRFLRMILEERGGNAFYKHMYGTKIVDVTDVETQD
ncbi:MAG: hypothetical protein F4X44_00810 [Gammaproteobacteria bacterium]|nr:hypothetical protein [Gammaproteobacteria bacterium]MYD79144.1 hypothetical protein [Gammaproteobacteria bacterium]